jgi:multiple inositol-polyphosphate phosphatase/2,3-bisphosphoglycerate 3-phosphatase
MLINVELIFFFFLYVFSLQEKIVAPHLKIDYNTVCTVKLEKPEQNPSITSKLSLLFRWPFLLGNDDKQSRKDDL